MLRFTLLSLAALTLASPSEAAGRKRSVPHATRATVTPQHSTQKQQPTFHAAAQPFAPVSIPTGKQSLQVAAVEAIDEVNRQRAARGLKAYIRDDNLTAGAMGAAKFRADHLMFGHTASDHSYLPAATFQRFRLANIASGCAAYPPSYGFMACAVYDDYTYGGAAYVIGRDGRKFCQLFVAGGPASLKHGSMFGR